MIAATERQPRLLTHPDPVDTEVLEYEYEPGNGTRYHGWCVRLQDDRTLIAVEPTMTVNDRPGRSWYVFGWTDFLSWDYTREKLAIPEGDLWALHRFVGFMLGRRYNEAPYGERP